MLQYFQVVK